MKPWRLLVLLAAVVGLAGCANKTVMEYNANAWGIVPVLHPGETIDWPGLTIVWDRGDSPCVTGSSPCVIKKGLTGSLYSYHCDKMNCDPEIAVDDPSGIRPATLAAGVVAPVRPTDVIQIACVQGAPQPITTVVHQGDTIGWGAVGSDVHDGWKVTIVNQAGLCKETTSPIQGQMICTVIAAPTVSYTYTVADACANAQAGPSTINVTPR